jgi:aquaporin Z
MVAEVRVPTLLEKCVSEFLGTFILLCVGIGAAIFSSVQTGVSPSGAPLNVAWDPGFIALAVGLSIGVGIYAFGNISGGHFNPAVSLAFLLSGRMPRRDFLPYLVSQVLGALTGMAVVFLIALGYTNPGGLAHTIPYSTAMGANGYAANGAPYFFAAWSVVLLEIVATFLFTMIILFVTDKDAWKGFHGLAIGLTLSILVLFGINVDGLSVNPARSTGSAVLAAAAGVGWPLVQLWAFWVAPLIGAALGATLWRWFRAHPP